MADPDLERQVGDPLQPQPVTVAHTSSAGATGSAGEARGEVRDRLQLN